MSQQELLTRVLSVLSSLGIDYMVTGSVASSLQGEPRSTHDVDLVVSIRPGRIADLVAAFPAPEFYLDEQDARAALRHGLMFNLIHVSEGDKVDFWPLTASAFDESRFRRRRRERVFGVDLIVSCAEDTILAKLDWARRQGGSEKQFTDALRVFEVQHGQLDLGYLEEWARRLGVVELWERLRAEAQV